MQDCMCLTWQSSEAACEAKAVYLPAQQSVSAGMGIHHCQGGGGAQEVPGHPEPQGGPGHPASADPVCQPPAGHSCGG